MTDANRKVLEKLRRLDRLAQSAATAGEREAAESARRRLVERLEKEGVHVAPELVAEVGADAQTQPLSVVTDGPTTEIAEDLILDPMAPGAGSSGVDASARTVVAAPVEISAYDAMAPIIEAPVEAPALNLNGAARARPSGRPLPPAGATPIGVLPEEIVVRSPVIADVQWLEAEEVERAAGGTVIEPELVDPTRVAPQAQDSSPKTPIMGTPLPLDPNLGSGRRRAPPTPAYDGRAPSTPPYGTPLSGRPSAAPSAATSRAPRSGRVSSGEKAESGKKSWGWKKIVLVAIAGLGALELIAFFFAPNLDPMSSRGEARARRASLVDQSARACMGGAVDACVDIGTAISQNLESDALWGRLDRKSCVGGDSVACGRLGQRYASEARERLRSSSRLSALSEEQKEQERTFQRVACALGASACAAGAAPK